MLVASTSVLRHAGVGHFVIGTLMLRTVSKIATGFAVRNTRRRYGVITASSGNAAKSAPL